MKESDTVEVAALEQSLIDGGLPVEEVMRLCTSLNDLHPNIIEVSVRQKALPKSARMEKPFTEPGRPACLWRQ
jgi:DUF438 domain-containing protein